MSCVNASENGRVEVEVEHELEVAVGNRAAFELVEVMPWRKSGSTRGREPACATESIRLFCPRPEDFGLWRCR